MLSVKEVEGDVEKDLSQLPPLHAIKPRRKKQLVAPEDCRPFESVLSCDDDSYKGGDTPCNITTTSTTTTTSTNPALAAAGGDEGASCLPLPGVSYLDNLMSASECAALCRQIDSNPDGVLSFWSGTGRDDEAARSFRDADTIELQSSFIAETLWARAEKALSEGMKRKSITSEDIETNDDCEKDTLGEWHACGFNEDLLFARYPALGAFAPHTDGRSIKDFNTRSFFSVIIFLNSIPLTSGGSTKFYSVEAKSELVKEFISAEEKSLPLLPSATLDPEGNNSVYKESRYRWSSPSKYQILEVEAVAGRCLIFDQKYVHEGSLVLPPYCKYIIRSDVMFRRMNATCDSETDMAAYEIYRRGEELSENGQVDEAIKLFKTAFRMSPALKAIYG